MNRTFKIIILLLVSILCFSSFVFAAETSDENQLTVESKFEVVDKTKCIIDFGEYGHFEKYLASYDENSVTLQLDVTNNATESQKKVPSEIFFVIDNSLSLRVQVTETETRKDLIYNSAKVLATKLHEADNEFKMGIISFSSCEDYTKEGTLADATLKQSLTSDNELVLNAIESINNDYFGSRTNIEAGLELAKQNFTDNNSKKYIILLTDGVPNDDIHGNTLQYSDIVMTNTKNKLLELDEAGINVISVLTDIDTTAADRDDGRTYAELAEDVFGTTENPTVGIYYFTTSNNLKDIVEKNVFNNIEIIPGTKLTNIVIKDYFPQEIIDNFEFSLVSTPETGTVTADVDKETNSITWNIESLDAGDSATFQYKLTLKDNYSKDIVDEIIPTNRKVDITDDQGDDETSTDSPKVRVTEKVTPIPEPEPEPTPEPEPEPTPEPKPEPKPDNTVIPAPKLPQTGTNSFIIASIILLVIGISIFEYIKYNKYNIK